jgi:hypothetical protein
MCRAVMTSSRLRQLPAEQPEQHREGNDDVPRVQQRAAALDPRELYSRRFLSSRKAAVVLVDEALALEPEEVCIGPEETLRVRLARQDPEVLVLERLQVARADTRLVFDLRQLEPSTRTRVPKAAADLEHV